MHAFFNTKNPVLQGIVKFPDWQYVRDGLRRNLGTVMSFYRRNPMAVKSDHFLVRILQSIAIPQSLNLQRYYDNVDAMALNMSMALKMTSSIYRGSLFNGVFYGDDSPEILIAHNESFDINQAHRDWTNLAPVKVLRHPRSDLALNLPDGSDSGIESGIVVIAINIPMLAIQYRAFRLNEMAEKSDVESQKSVMQFVHMYVLPNMLPSHLDLALFNRLDNLQRNAPLGASKKGHSFYLTSYASKVDDVMLDVLKALEDQGKDFTGILRTIPTVVKNDMEQALVLPDMAATQQVDWALSIARLRHLLFMFSASKAGAGVRSQHHVNKLLRDILSYRTNNIMRTMLPTDVRLEVENEISAIVEES